MESNAEDLLTIDIKNITYGGMGLGHLNGKVIFVPYTAPDDRIMTEIVKKEADYFIGRLVKILSASPFRQEPKCPHFGVCGGCQWQHIGYDNQVRYKEAIIKEAFKRIACMEVECIAPCIASPSQFNYRHRMQFNINHRNKRPHIGLYKPKSHDLVDIHSCSIAHPMINKVLKALWEWLDKTDDRQIQGVDITCDVSGQKAILVLRYMKGSIEAKKKDFSILQMICPEITGALIRMEEYKKASSVLVDSPNLDLEYNDIHYIIGPETFIQVNLGGNEQLIEKVVAGLPSRSARILELHCGMGNFSIPLSKRTQSLFGIESSPEAYRYAQMNAHYNRRPNCSFIKKSDVKGIKQLIRAGMNFSALVLDPPRSGCKEILDLIPSLKISHIVYVSCNPVTLARDLAVLVNDQKFHLESVQPIDMFPQTYHIETVSVLSKDN